MMMPTQHVELTEQQANFVRESVDAGHYRDADEVVRAALRLLEKQEQLDRLKLEHMRRLVQEGIDDMEAGRYVTITSETLDDFMDSVSATGSKRKRA